MKTFSLKGKLHSKDGLRKACKTGFLQVRGCTIEQQEGGLLDKRIIWKAAFSKDAAQIEYGEGNGSALKGRLEALKKFFEVLILTENAFTPDENGLLATAAQALEDAMELIDNKTDALIAENEGKTAQCRELSEKTSALKKELCKASERIAFLDDGNRELARRVRELEGRSGEELKAAAMQWLEEHGSVIDLPAFSKQYGIGVSRTEEILKQLAEEGNLVEIK